MKILVTGSSGQIGSYVVDQARDRGHNAVGLDLEPDGGERTDLSGDIREAELCRRAMEGFDAVVHCAAQISVQKSLEDPKEDAEHNVLGTINLLQAASEHGLEAGRFVNVSSAAVYGDPVELPIGEDHPTDPEAPYGQSKLAAEGYADLYRRTSELDVVTVRPFNVYSPRQNPNNPYSGVISIFADRVRDGKPPVVFGDGSQTRDFVHAEDIARWMVELATRGGELPFDTVNLGTGEETSILELAETMIDLADLQVEPEHDERPEGEVDHSRADASRQRKLGLETTIDLSQGLEEMLR